ncbi:VOC family protein [Pontibacter locisalis]|uniref:VOC family protein n=1 Tax=Pontibacter locisalis TaxID=1719035 RepID=A0ABW5IH94_9BACT
MGDKNNAVSWFEIPVKDMQRAITFYNQVFGYELEHHVFGDEEMAWFPFKEDGTGASGSLVKNEEFYKPSVNGILVYFSSPSGDLATELAKVESAGGRVLQAKKLITEEIGYMGLFLDTEGNRLAIHSR